MREHIESSNERSQIERQNGRQFLREFLPAIFAYTLLVAALVSLIDLETAGWWKYVAMLAPLIPWAFGVRALSGHMNRIDERERLVQVNGMAAGFAAAVGIAFALGFLSIAGLETDPWGPWVIFSVAMLVWLLATARQAAVR